MSKEELLFQVIEKLSGDVLEQYEVLVTLDYVKDNDAYHKTLRTIDQIEMEIEKLVGWINKSKTKKKVKETWFDKIDPNVLLNAGVSLTSILLILNYEKADVITSKAFGIFSKMIGK